MPHEATIRIFALGLLALAAVWFLAAAIGLSPRAMRVRRAIKRSGPGTMLCGACGHPATSLGSIDTCPECGSLYATVGLDGRATPSRWAPPVFVLGVFLLGVWALGSIWLAPVAARWANEWSVGSAQLERWQSRAALRTTDRDPATDQPFEVVAELSRELIGPATLPAGATDRPALGGTATLHLMHGPAVQGASSTWNTDPMAMSDYMKWQLANPMGGSVNGMTAPPPAPAVAGALPSPWDTLRTNAPTATLRWSIGSEAWTLTDTMGGSPQRGTGLPEGVSAMAVRLGFDPAGDEPEPMRRNLAGSLGIVTSEKHTGRLRTIRPSERAHLYFGRFLVLGEVTATPTRTTIHPSAPMGLTAAIATSASLLLVALVLLWLSWRAGRAPASAPI
ncbi:MAG: hypothetical protein ACIAS6_15140 [Phycisphaerales bacterium JB060]